MVHRQATGTRRRFEKSIELCWASLVTDKRWFLAVSDWRCSRQKEEACSTSLPLWSNQKNGQIQWHRQNICVCIYIYIDVYIYICIYIYTHYDIHTLHHITSHHITSRHITSHHITSHHITSHHTHYITLHYITLHYITLHYITYHTCIYIYTYIYIFFYILLQWGVYLYNHVYIYSVSVLFFVYACILIAEGSNQHSIAILLSDLRYQHCKPSDIHI